MRILTTTQYHNLTNFYGAEYANKYLFLLMELAQIEEMHNGTHWKSEEEFGKNFIIRHTPGKPTLVLLNEKLTGFVKESFEELIRRYAAL